MNFTAAFPLAFTAAIKREKLAASSQPREQTAMEMPLQPPGPGLLNPYSAFKPGGGLTPCWPFLPHPAMRLTKCVTQQRCKQDGRCGRRETHLNLVFSFFLKKPNPSLKRCAAGRPLPEGVCIGRSGCCYESCCYGTAPILFPQTKPRIAGEGISPLTFRRSREG